jgi:hypothetical protein
MTHTQPMYGFLEEEVGKGGRSKYNQKYTNGVHVYKEMGYLLSPC